MFSKNLMRKFSIVFFVTAVVTVLGITGCTSKISLEDVTDKNDNQQDSNQNQNDQTQNNNQNQNPNDNQTNPNDEPSRDIDSNKIPFLNINLVGGDPPLMKREGIFYFTKSQHPPVVERSFRYDTHNGWLIQLDDPALKGKKIKVKEIKRTGNVYDIIVSLQPGGDVTKPAHGFFEVGIFDMPTSSKFRIYNEAGQKLWPKF